MTSYAFLVRDLVQHGDMWEITIGHVGNAGTLALYMWPPSGLHPYGITIREGVIITEPEVEGSFEIRGLNSEALSSMDPEFAALFRGKGFDPDAPPPGKHRVWWNDFTEHWDYDDAEFAERYVDNWTHAEIQPDWMYLGNTIDQQILKVRLANGLEYRVELGKIGQGPLSGNLWVQEDGVILPSMRASGVTLDALNCPRLYSLRKDLHRLLYEIEQDRLMLAYIVAAFADVGTVASGGGDPDLYDKVMAKAREAQRLADR